MNHKWGWCRPPKSKPLLRERPQSQNGSHGREENSNAVQYRPLAEQTLQFAVLCHFWNSCSSFVVQPVVGVPHDGQGEWRNHDRQDRGCEPHTDGWRILVNCSRSDVVEHRRRCTVYGNVSVCSGREHSQPWSGARTDAVRSLPLLRPKGGWREVDGRNSEEAEAGNVSCTYQPDG